MHTIENINATMTELNRIADAGERTARRGRGADPAACRRPGAVDRWPTRCRRRRLTNDARRASAGSIAMVIGDVASKLQPLGQLAEAAGGMFGLRNLRRAASCGGGRRRRTRPRRRRPRPRSRPRVTHDRRSKPGGKPATKSDRRRSRPAAQGRPAKKAPTPRSAARSSGADGS